MRRVRRLGGGGGNTAGVPGGGVAGQVLKWQASGGYAWDADLTATAGAVNWGSVGGVLAAQNDLATALSAKAPLSGAIFPDSPAMPTPSADDNSTKAANTAYYVGQQGTAAPQMNGSATAGTSKKWSPIDHVHPVDTSRAADNAVFHLAVTGEIAGLTEKVAPVSGDHILVEDSEAGNAKRRVKIGNLPAGAGGPDTNALHGNTASEINALTLKKAPTIDDMLVIEDAANSFAKRKTPHVRVVGQVATYAALRALDPAIANGDGVYVRGRAADSDGGEGVFVYDATATGYYAATVSAAGSGYGLQRITQTINGVSIDVVTDEHGALLASWLNATGSSKTADSAATAITGVASAWIDFQGRAPIAGDTIVLNSETWTFVNGAPGANQLRADSTMATWVATLNGSARTETVKCTYTEFSQANGDSASPGAAALVITSKGVADNTYTVAVGSANPSNSGFWRLSAATLLGKGASGTVTLKTDNDCTHLDSSVSGYTKAEGGGSWVRQIVDGYITTASVGVAPSNEATNAGLIHKAASCCKALGQTLYLSRFSANVEFRSPLYLACDVQGEGTYVYAPQTGTAPDHSGITWNGDKWSGGTLMYIPVDTPSTGDIAYAPAALAVLPDTDQTVDGEPWISDSRVGAVLFRIGDPRARSNSAPYYGKYSFGGLYTMGYGIRIRGGYNHSGYDFGFRLQQITARQVRPQSIATNYTEAGGLCIDAPGCASWIASCAPMIDQVKVDLYEVEGGALPLRPWRLDRGQDCDITVHYIEPASGSPLNGLITCRDGTVRGNTFALPVTKQTKSGCLQPKYGSGSSLGVIDFEYAGRSVYDAAHDNRVVGPDAGERAPDWEIRDIGRKAVKSASGVTIPCLYQSPDPITTSYFVAGDVLSFWNSGDKLWWTLDTRIHKMFDLSYLGWARYEYTAGRINPSQIGDPNHLTLTLFDAVGRQLAPDASDRVADNAYAVGDIYRVYNATTTAYHLYRVEVAGTSFNGAAPVVPTKIRQADGSATVSLIGRAGEHCGMWQGVVNSNGTLDPHTLTAGTGSLRHEVPITFGPAVASVRFTVGASTGNGGGFRGYRIAVRPSVVDAPLSVDAPCPGVRSGDALPADGYVSRGDVIQDLAKTTPQGWLGTANGFLGAAWASGTYYVPGTVVTSNSKAWRCMLGSGSLLFTAPNGTGTDVTITGGFTLGTNGTNSTLKAYASSSTSNNYSIIHDIDATETTIGTIDFTTATEVAITVTSDGANYVVPHGGTLRVKRTAGADLPNITLHAGSDAFQIATDDYAADPTDTFQSVVAPHSGTLITVTGMPAVRDGGDGYIWQEVPLGAVRAFNADTGSVSIRTVTGTADTPTVDDRGKRLRCTASSAVAITVNDGVFAANDVLSITQIGDGVVSLAASGTAAGTGAFTWVKYKTASLHFTAPSAYDLIPGA